MNLLASEINGSSIEQLIIEMVGKIGEKIELSYYETVEGESVVAYNHPGTMIGVEIVENKKIKNPSKDIAMQIIAMNPIALDQDSVSQAVVEKEIEIGKDQAIQEGKPAEMAEKIALGRLNKFFKENTLLSQQFVRDNKFTVEQFLNNSEKGLTISAFKRFSLS